LDRLSVKKIKQGKKMKFTHNNTEYELMFLTVAGSHLYGNSRPESDWDYRGVFMASNDTFTGLLGKTEQLEGQTVYDALVKAGMELNETDDVVLYELNRFCQLALDNNPNIMDMLCHDYTNPKFSLYKSNSGQKLLENKDLFMSTKLKHTFSGYAMAQLKRIKGHNKWITEFPDTDAVLSFTKYMFEQDRVDFNWVCDNFGGEVAEKVTGENAQKNTNKECVSWKEFVTLRAEMSNGDGFLENYRLPQLIDYCHPKDLKGKQMSIKAKLSDYELFERLGITSLELFLRKQASFRTLSPSMLVVYTGGNGLFSKEGNLKANDPEKVGEFVCLLSVDQMKYKSDKDHVKKMWHWKCNRNEKRGALEEQFGYDTKHASHLVRLMEGCKDILSTSVYEPTLSGDRLKLVNDVRNGEYTYEWVVEYAEKLDSQLQEMMKKSELQKKPNHKKVNELVLELRKN